MKPNIMRISEVLFKQFLQQRVLEISAPEKGLKSFVELTLRSDFAAGQAGRSHVFISDIENIQLPSGASFAPYVTLYGVPPGMFGPSAKGTKGKPKEKFRNGEVYDGLVEGHFRRLRAGLLYAFVWFEKAKNVAALTKVMQRIDERGLFVHGSFATKLLNELGKHASFPLKPSSNPSLSNDRYFDSYNWFGVYLSTLFFPDTGKMEESHKKWFVQLSKREGLTTPAPPMFVDGALYIIGYMTALKAYSDADYAVAHIEELLNCDNCLEAGDKDVVVFLALLFLGLYEPQADLYYLCGNGKRLMQYVEQKAWSMFAGIAFAEEACWQMAQEDLKKIDESPQDNCVTYYRFKNTAIRDRDWFEFGAGNGLSYPDKVALVHPEDVAAFIEETGRWVDFRSAEGQTIWLTASIRDYELLAQSGAKVILAGDKMFGAYIQGTYSADLSESLNVVAIQPGLQLPVLFNPEAVNCFGLEQMAGVGGKVGLFFVENGLVPQTEAVLIKAFLNVNPPELIVIVNYLPDRNSKANPKGKMTGEAQPFTEVFKEFKVREIRQQADTPDIWEAVVLLTGVLAPYDYKDLVLFDVRRKQNLSEVGAMLFRATRDVLYFDAGMKYIAMNLNPL